MTTDPHPSSAELAGLDAHDLLAQLVAGELSSTELVTALIARIETLDRDPQAGHGQDRPGLHAMITLAPDALELAAAADAARSAGDRLGSLHGLPVLVKDNIDTAGPLGTTAGSLALAGRAPATDAGLVTRLRSAGALVLGKTNLSEWANIRSTRSSSGWSAIGGQCRNPHALDHSPGGSSAGSGAAVAAGYAPLAVGTETDGSILCPAAFTGVVGLKPTLHAIPTDGVVPIAHSQDTPGPMTRSVRDAGLLQAVLSGQPLRTEHPPADHRVAGLRLGLPRAMLWGSSSAADEAVTTVLTELVGLGVELVDGVTLPPLPPDDAYPLVLLTELAHDLPAYLTTRPGIDVHTIGDLVAFNLAHADAELVYFGQELFEQAAERTEQVGYARLLADPTYRRALAECRRAARTDGIDAALSRHRLDALVCPTDVPAPPIDHRTGDQHFAGCSTYPAIAGYPALTVPCGSSHGLPLGIAFLGAAGSEALLLRLGAAVERALGRGPRPLLHPINTSCAGQPG